MGWALVSLVLSVLLVAGSFALNTILWGGYGPGVATMPARFLCEKTLQVRVTFTGALLATVALYWPMLLCVCVAAADRRRIKRSMTARRAALAGGIGAALSGLLYVLSRKAPLEVIPNWPGILILSSLGVFASTNYFLLLFLTNTACYSVAAFLVLFRFCWRERNH